MTTQDQKKLLQAYLEGKISPDEFIQLRQNLEILDEKQLNELLSSLWMDFDEQDKHIRQRTKILFSELESSRILASNRTEPHEIQMTKKSWTASYMPYLAYAAMLVIAFLGTMTYYYVRENATLNQLMHRTVSFSAHKDQEAYVILPDSTHIELHSDSRLSYQQDFGETNRTVKLQGEGFFRVSKDAKCPFIIHIEDMQIKVLGTVFNVYNDRKKDVIEVALLSGCVQTKTFGKYPSTTILHSHQVLTYSIKTGKTQTYRQTNSMNSTWKATRIHFENLPLQNVFKILTERYAVVIHTPEDLLMKDRFTGTYENYTLNQILHVLKEYYPININEKEGQIFVSVAKKIS